MTDHATNRLKDSASPYLRSAAHQPVDWHEWGDAAFAKARAETKPILLDIGAVWCHWCHVIDRESYENPEIAALINQSYVAVKVDRDERPDVDARYQSAVSAISGQGGWPLTAFLTPEGKPFFGGTYFPPEDAMGRPGFKRILVAVAEAFQSRREEIDKSAGALEDAVRQAELFPGAKAALDPGVVESMADSMIRQCDLQNGGFGRSPKFPHPAALDFLLERYQATHENSYLTVAATTLEKMASGGVYDQLAGGFHRYSVDERWLVPHFEKMSYDNSELLKNYLHGFQVTGDPIFRDTAEGIISWVFDTLSDHELGGFYASQDADISLDDDGDYFTWTEEELRAALTPDEARVMALLYDVGPTGEMHHNPAKNVLWIASSLAEISQRTGLSEADVRIIIARAKSKMLTARAQRQTPAIDKTIYVNWNSMFISAFLEAARVLGRADCRDFALKTLDRILAEAWDDARGFAHRVDPAASSAPRVGPLLDDQVFAAAALFDAYEATLDLRYFHVAERAIRLTIDKFADIQNGGFFDRASDAAPIGGLDVCRKPLQDSPTPGVNSMAAIVLDRLYSFTGNEKYRVQAESALEAFAGIAPQLGLFAATYALAADLHSRHAIQIVVTGDKNDPTATALASAANSVYRFSKSVLRLTPQLTAANSLAPALKETLPHLDARAPQAIVCMGSTCSPPVNEPEKLIGMLAVSGLKAAASER